jgi:hypothetical protein
VRAREEPLRQGLCFNVRRHHPQPLAMPELRFDLFAAAADEEAARYIALMAEDEELAVFQEVMAAGRKTHPQGRNDSVLVCIADGCGNPSYPVDQCNECRTRYLLHILPDTKCPVCHPEIATAAAEHGIDLTPADLPRR